MSRPDRAPGAAGSVGVMVEAAAQWRLSLSWTGCRGLHPDGLQALYGDHPGFEAVQLEAAVDSRSEVLESPDPLGQLQEVHWAVHRAHHTYQEAAEDRRHLAADIGEAIGRFVDALVVAGWSEEEARNADVRAIARGGN